MDYAIEYIIQPYKMDNGRLVSSYACTPQIAAGEMFFTQKTKGTGANEILAHHLIQSFAKDEITPEKAMELGKQFADRLLKGQHEYVIATHIDRDCVHNHIIFNAVNMVTGKTFETEQNRNKKVVWKIRKISDKICEENKLSVVENSEQGKGKSYYEWMQDKAGKSYKAKLKIDLDDTVKMSHNLDELVEKMRAKGYEVECGTHIKFKAPGQQRFTRAKTLGYYYTEQSLAKRIEKLSAAKAAQKQRNIAFVKSLNMPNLIDTSQEKFNQGDGLEHWAKMQNVQATAQIWHSLSEIGIRNFGDLELAIITQNEQRISAQDKIREIEQQVIMLQMRRRNLAVYEQLKPMYNKYKMAKDKDKFFRENESDILLYENAVEELRAVYKSKKLPSVKELDNQIGTFNNKKNRLHEVYKQSHKEAYRLEKMRQKIEQFNRGGNAKDKDKTNSMER